MNEPRVLHLTVRRDGGGTESNLRRLIARWNGARWVALEDWLGPRLNPLRIPMAIRELRRSEEPVIFCYGIRSHLVARLAFPLGGRRLVGNIRCETDFVGWKAVWKRLFGSGFHPWLSNSRKALGDSPGFVIYNGIDVPPIESPLLPNLPQPTFAVLASGHPKKGHRFAIKLWVRLGRPGCLIFAGNLGPELKALAESRGVVCPGYVDAGALLRSIDMLWIPSRAEGIPTVALEAMARGVPVLSTPAGGIGEIMRHGWNGFLLPRRRWELFLRSIDWENARAVGERGRQVVFAKYPLSRTLRRFRAAAWLAMRRDASTTTSPP